MPRAAENTAKLTHQSFRQSFRPEVIYLTSESAEDELSARVLSRVPEAQVIEYQAGEDPLSARNHSFKNLSEQERFSLGKRRLLLTRHKGSWLKACPGTSAHVCCNLWIVNPGEGCPMDCTYCYLQSYLQRNPTLKLYTNTFDMLAEIEAKALANPSRLFRVGTGELIDSLVWDELTDSSCDLVPFFARVPNLVLELKTKCDFVDNLVSMRNEHDGKTVISWSVNARQVVDNDEKNTASLDQRIAAAARVIDAGYRVGLHFDPLIHFEGWQDGYREAIRDIFSQLDSSRIAWVSVSTLRYQRDMQKMMEIRFPESKLPYGEQFLAKDNKLRYLQPIRFALEKFVWKELKSVYNEMPVYMCMETPAAWREVAGGSPVAGSELVEIFSRRGRLPIIEDSP